MEVWQVVSALAAVVAVLIAILKFPFRRKSRQASSQALVKNVGDHSPVTINQYTIQEFRQTLRPVADVPIKGANHYPTLGTTSLPRAGDQINREIDEAVHLIKSHNFQTAKTELFRILGKIENQKDSYKKEMARVYNNLGVCFTRPKDEGGDLDQSFRYYNLALEYDPDLTEARRNLASVYLDRGGEGDYGRAYEIANRMWREAKGHEFLNLQLLIWSMYYYKTPQETIGFIEESEEIKKVVNDSELLLQSVATINLECGNVEQALQLANRALSASPKSARSLSLKARALMVRAQRNKLIPSHFSIVPQFEDYRDIENALELLEKALDLSPEHDRQLVGQIKLDITLCTTWLSRVSEAKYRTIMDSIDTSTLSLEQQRQLRVHDFARCLQARKFEAALEILKADKDWDDTPYHEKRGIAHVFLMEGAVEEAQAILRGMETIAEKERDVEFWFELSLVDVLLDNRKLAITEAEKARHFSRGSALEKEVLSRLNALMVRYAAVGEADRLVASSLDYHKQFADDRTIRVVRALDEKGQLTNEMKNMLLEQKQWYENIRKLFTTQPIPIYLLEKAFKRPFVEIASFGAESNDPDFRVEFMLPTEDFIKEVSSNFHNARSCLFDYSSFLNLSKMGLLGHLHRFGKTICLSRGLFDKMQAELLSVEQEDLRRLWNFVRKSTAIKIINKARNGRLRENKLCDIFDDWLVQSIKISEEENSVFVTDDLRLSRFLKSEGVACTNTWVLLQEMKGREWIDSKMYAQCIGDFAERLYTFIAFSGDDLFHIVMEDKGKITLRTYHLVNQVFLPGCVVETFTIAFMRFIDLLWATGLLAADKVKWVKFLSMTIVRLIESKVTTESVEQFKRIAPHVRELWLLPITKGSKEELALLETELDAGLANPNLRRVRAKLREIIRKRLEPQQEQS